MKSKLLVLIFTMISVFIVFNEDKQDHNQFRSDACGYYLYLPALFIYHDIGKFDFFPEINQKYQCVFALNPPLPGTGDKRLDKYPLGVCFFELPFFLAAHSYCLLSNKYLADGFTLPYQVAMMLSNIVWAALGLFILSLFLKKNYNDNVVAITLFCIAFGTNLYNYTAFSPGIGHPISFFLFSALLFLTDKWYTDPLQKLNGIVLGLTMGLIALVRPINAIVFIVPLLYRVNNLASLKARFELLRKNTVSVVLILFFLCCVVLIQLCYWHYITGRWVYYSYQGEGFNVLHPNIFNGLFSYRKGWFVYTPMALVALTGFYFLWKREKELAPTLMVFFGLIIYACFSWRQWWYGGGFGCRALIETFPVLAIPLAAMTDYFYRSRIISAKISYFSILVIITLLNLFQTYQYNMGLIHWSRMTKEYYWKVFGKMDYNFNRAENEKYLVPPEDEDKYNN